MTGQLAGYLDTQIQAKGAESFFKRQKARILDVFGKHPCDLLFIDGSDEPWFCPSQDARAKGLEPNDYSNHARIDWIEVSHKKGELPEVLSRALKTPGVLKGGYPTGDYASDGALILSVLGGPIVKKARELWGLSERTTKFQIYNLQARFTYLCYGSSEVARDHRSFLQESAIDASRSAAEKLGTDDVAISDMAQFMPEHMRAAWEHVQAAQAMLMMIAKQGKDHDTLRDDHNTLRDDHDNLAEKFDGHDEQLKQITEAHPWHYSAINYEHGLFKPGITDKRDPQERVKQHGYEFEVAGAVRQPRHIEKLMLAAMKREGQRPVIGKEFFSLNPITIRIAKEHGYSFADLDMSRVRCVNGQYTAF